MRGWGGYHLWFDGLDAPAVCGHVDGPVERLHHVVAVHGLCAANALLQHLLPARLARGLD